MTSTQLPANPPITCPDWCAEHHGSVHFQWLFTSWPPVLPAEDRANPVIAVSLAQSLPEDGEAYEPDMGIALFGHEPPAAIDPADARALAAALIRGAEVVEGYLTEECSGCRRGISPQEAADADGTCLVCQMTERRDRRAMMRGPL